MSAVAMIVGPIILPDLFMVHVVAFSLFSFPQRSAPKDIDVPKLASLTHPHTRDEAVGVESHIVA